MTPAARVQAAIEILDEIQGGAPAERALTGWARRSRFAGSKDRAAIRDHVYDVLRQRNSCVQAGGAASGRAMMIGLLALQGHKLDALFCGDGYGPKPLTEDEHPTVSSVSGFDLPEWVVPELQATLGDDFAAVEARLKTRAPVILRANLRKTNRVPAIAALAKEGILAEAHSASDTAITVTEGARRIAQSAAYTSGLVELQDASSQAAIEALPLSQGMKVLDYCAGGGGKLLAIAARIDGQFCAHDANPQRMRDLPARAKRAGIKVLTTTKAEIAQKAPFDLVFCDVPCSGSGSWRRDPEGKWKLSETEFQDLLKVQQNILQEASAFVAPDGVLVYATCSMCRSENLAQVETFIKANPAWTLGSHSQWTPLQDCDGFFSAVLQRA